MVKKVELKNGLRIVLVPDQTSPTTTVLILCEAGSEYERKSENGISHFLEHLVFKGTTNRPKPGMISRELDALGAESNAFTGQEYTGYWAKAQASKTEQLLDIVSDLYLNPIFDAAEIDKERGVIIEEINMYEDTPKRKVGDVYLELLYGDQPAGWDIAGPKETIMQLTRDQIVRYRTERYQASSTVVVVAGKFNPRTVTKFITERFGALRKASVAPKKKTKAPKRGVEVKVRHKKSDQIHLMLGVPTFSMFDERRYALSIAADVLGSGMSSRLFYRIREELGAAYYVGADADLSLDHGSFLVAVGAAPAKVPLVIKAVLEELRRLAVEPVSAKELKKVKDHFAGTFAMSLETSDALATFYGMQEILTRKLVHPAEYVRRIRSITAEDIRRVMRSVMKDDMLKLAVIGPYKGEGEFKKLLTK